MIKRLTLAALAALLVPAVMLSTVAFGEHSDPSAAAKSMPGALGTIEYKPGDWIPNATSWWKDSDGVDPATAGCHIGVTKEGVPNGRSFGEACLSDQVLVESNPAISEIHKHDNDLGHPDTFDCKAWCVGAVHATSGVCKVVTGPAPCAASAVCACNVTPPG